MTKELTHEVCFECGTCDCGECCLPERVHDCRVVKGHTTDLFLMPPREQRGVAIFVADAISYGSRNYDKP